MGIRKPALRYVLAFHLVFIVACSAWAGVIQQTRQGAVLLPPPAQGLVAIQLPDTRNMEPEVREHIKLAERALALVVKELTTPADKLGEAYGLMGEIYQAYSLNSSAKDCHLNASQLAVKDFRCVYLLGKLHEREGEAQRAISYYNLARNLRPDYLPLFVSLGNTSLQLNCPDEAESFFRRALELAEAVYGATGSINHGALVAMALAELGRCDKAAVWLKRMITKATEEGNRELAEKLKAELNRYERVPMSPGGWHNLFRPDTGTIIGT